MSGTTPSGRGRTISYSEVSTALDCMARWDFSYGGHLAGSALQAKRIAPLLSGGRAWGAAVAAWHLGSGTLFTDTTPVAALDASLEADADRQREFGVHDAEAHTILRTDLLARLDHYVATNERLSLEQPEHEMEVAIPSRSGRRASTKYRFLAYADGVIRQQGRVWLVEFKLRSSLTSVELIALSRQIRWYAWAFWQATGTMVDGVLVDERWNEAPKPPRMLASGKPSHAKDQLTTVEQYRAVCAEHGVEPSADAEDAMRARRWSQRVPVLFRPGELEEAGRELVSAAKLIGLLDSGGMMPLRNAKRSNCQGCQYREICPDPQPDLVETLFERKPPKRERREVEAA